MKKISYSRIKVFSNGCSSTSHSYSSHESLKSETSQIGKSQMTQPIWRLILLVVNYVYNKDEPIEPSKNIIVSQCCELPDIRRHLCIFFASSCKFYGRGASDDYSDCRCGAAVLWPDRPWVIDAPMNRHIFETYIQTQLAPTLSKGDVVIMDNLSSHKSPAT